MDTDLNELQPRLRTVSRADFWQRHVTQCKDSGLSKMAYCKQNALIYHQMVYWSSKEESKVEPEASCGGFIAMNTVASSKSGSDLLVRLPSGISIEGINDHSMGLVRKLIDQL